jgi:hypothetical protein
MNNYRVFSDAELITHLRRAASTWFRNADLLALEEMIRRYHERHLAAKDSIVRGFRPGSVSEREP